MILDRLISPSRILRLVEPWKSLPIPNSFARRTVEGIMKMQAIKIEDAQRTLKGLPADHRKAVVSSGSPYVVGMVR